MTTSDLTIRGVSCGRWQTNVWVLEAADGTAMIVDPGEGAAPVVHDLLKRADKVAAIACTHGHIDHTWDAAALAREFNAPVHLDEADLFLWRNPGRTFGAANLEQLAVALGVRWEDVTAGIEPSPYPHELAVGPASITTIHNPGHTPGHRTIHVNIPDGTHVRWSLESDDGEVSQPTIVLSGDLLFAGSIGRSDFPEGSSADMDASLKSFFSEVQDGLVLPGHGGATTVSHERATNPFAANLGV